MRTRLGQLTLVLFLALFHWSPTPTNRAAGSDEVIYKLLHTGFEFEGEQISSFEDYVVLNNDDVVAFTALVGGKRIVFRVRVDNLATLEKVVEEVDGVSNISKGIDINSEGEVALYLLNGGSPEVRKYNSDLGSFELPDVSGLTSFDNRISMSNSPYVTYLKGVKSGKTVLFSANSSQAILVDEANGVLKSIGLPTCNASGDKFVFRAKQVSNNRTNLYRYEGTGYVRLIGRDEGFLSISSSSINDLGHSAYIGLTSTGWQIGIAKGTSDYQTYVNDANFSFVGVPYIDNASNLYCIIRRNGVGSDEIARISPSGTVTKILAIGDQLENQGEIDSLKFVGRGINDSGSVAIWTGLVGGDEAIVIANPRKIPSVKDRIEPDPPGSGTGNSLAVITHGHLTSSSNLQWMDDMKASMDSKLPANWEVQTRDYSALISSRSTPNQTYRIAGILGYADAAELFNEGKIYDTITITTYSAGIAYANAYAKRYKELNPSTKVHVTVLDGYQCPGAQETLLSYADNVVHYFTRGDIWCTESALPNTHNVDITNVIADPKHFSAVEWYQETIDAENYEGQWESWGWLRSHETAQFSSTLFPTDGRTTVIGENSVEKFERSEQLMNSLDLSSSNFIKSTTGQVIVDGTAVCLETGSPAWISFPVVIEEDQNLLEFDVQQLSDSEGQLSIYLNNKLLTEVDERFREGGKVRIPLLEDYRGVVQLGIRLDPHSNVNAVVDVDNIRFGIVDNSLAEVIYRGDMNGDGVVDNLDINAFVLALVDPTMFEIVYPGVERVTAGDCSKDGYFDNRDINPFVSILLGL